MHLRRLQLSWFRNFEAVEIRFERGLNIVIGGNGAGKSALLESVAWALYGAGAVRRSEASLRSMTARDGCTGVLLELEVEGTTCIVRRSIDSGRSEATLLRGDEVLASGPNEVAGAVAELLGADRETMLHACATGRRELQQLTLLSPAERLRLLARLLGHSLPAVIAAPLAEAVRALEQELADADDRMEALSSAPSLLAQLTAELERMQPQLEAAESLSARLHDDWSQKRQEVETKLAAYRARGDELRLQIERLAGDAAAARCPTCGQTLGSCLDGMLERLDDEAYVNAQDAKWLAQRQAQLTRRPTDLVAAETRRARLRTAVDERRERLARCEQAAQELWTVANERRRTAERLRSLQQEIRTAPRIAGALPVLPPAQLRAVTAHASDFVSFVTAGFYDGIALHADGRVHALRHGREVPVVSGGDEDLIALALRLAAMHSLAPSLPRLRLLLLDEPFAGMDAERRRRALEAARSMRGGFEQIILCTRDPDAAAAADHCVRL